jgi:integrase
MKPKKQRVPPPWPLTTLSPDLRSDKSLPPNQLTGYNAGLSINTRKKRFENLRDLVEYGQSSPHRPATWNADNYQQTARLYSDPEAYRDLSVPLFQGFANNCLAQGSAPTSTMHKLLNIKMYMRIVAEAGFITQDVLTQLLQVEPVYGPDPLPPRSKELRDPPRQQPLNLSDAQIEQLRTIDEASSPQDVRTALLVCLIADQGLYVGEIPSLRCEDLDLEHGRLRIDKRSGKANEIIQLAPTTLAVLEAYLSHVRNPAGYLVQGSRRNRQLNGQTIKDRSIFEQIRALGARIGFPDLAPRDCRHYWERKHQQ